MSEEDRTTEVQERGPRRLYRTRNDRVIAGVAGGLGRYFGIDPVIVRIAFAVSILIGGLGVLADVALALFVPTAPGEDGEAGPAPVERSRMLAIGVGVAIFVLAITWGVFDGPFWGWHGFFIGPGLLLVALVAGAIVVARGNTGRSSADSSTRRRSAVATVLIAIGAFIGLCVIALAAAWAGATGHGVVVATTIIVIGVLLALAAFSGGARWLIAPALALAIPLAAVSAADISFGDGVGEREYRPLAATAIPEDGYELGIGRLAVDLRSLDWKPNSVVDLNIDLGVGEAVVAVPSNVCVTTDTLTRAGNNVIAGNQSDGFDVHSNVNAGATAAPRLDLTGEVDFGELRVVNDDNYDISERGFHSNRPSRSAQAANLEAACGAPASPVTPTPPANTPDKPDKPTDGGKGN
jgi:phage shock protein PspC (stress-responsive transcriptional regulator)